MVESSDRHPFLIENINDAWQWEVQGPLTQTPHVRDMGLRRSTILVVLPVFLLIFFTCLQITRLSRRGLI
jgi:hypothetical protein